MVGSGRMVTSSRRAGRITNKTKLLIYRGSEKVDLAHAEVIQWNDQDGENAPKNQHVGAKGVESGEMLEHHLQAALSSHSLLHSQAQRTTTTTSSAAASPGSSSRHTKPDPAAALAPPPAALNYHIPTPDATGLTQNADYLRLYQGNNQRYHEPTNFIRFSDTVEEASGGWGGLGYCMDDEDEQWLADFNGKQQGSSGSGSGSGTVAVETPKEKEGKENVPVSAGRERRGKGKEREKDKDGAGAVGTTSSAPAPLVISEEAFEYIMGVLEKHVEDNVPTLHTDLALIPTFSSIEPLFSSPISPNFLPSNEVPRSLPETSSLIRMSRSIYSHWKDRRERRKGRNIMPQLNYDETNDGDPYVCFRRRDTRATRKTRRTDNYSVEQMQRLQYELRAAHAIAIMTVTRESEKKKLYDAEKEVWEAKWKLFETKKRWPSLGITREEEEVITGRMTTGATSTTPGGSYGGSASMSAMNGQAALQASHPNIPRMSKKMIEREKELEREKREKMAEVAARTQERTGGATGATRWFAPDELKARMSALRQRLEEETSRRKEADLDWDDATDSSYQPLPPTASEHGFRSVTALDPHWARDKDDEDYSLTRLPTVRLRRGRGGFVRLDRRYPAAPNRRGPQPSSSTEFSNWLFPDSVSCRPKTCRPRSIDEVDASPEDEVAESMKRRRLNEGWRYATDKGGSLGVGMGMNEDQDQVIIDDMDTKYIRHRITLLRADDIEKLQPDISVIRQAMSSIDDPVELPPMPVFIRPAPPSNQFVNAHLQQQQQMVAQQAAQMEQFHRFQLQAQLQAQMAVQQQQEQVQAQQQQAQIQSQQGQGQVQGQMPVQMMPSSDQLQQHQRLSSNGSTNGTPVMNNQMLPPNGQQNGRPPNKRTASNVSNANGSMPPPSSIQPRPSVSPNNTMQVPLPNGSSPHMMNGNLVNGKHLAANLQLQGQPIDPAIQQRLIAAARAQQHAKQQIQQQTSMNNAGVAGGMDMAETQVATLNAMIANAANAANAQQQPQLQNTNGIGNVNGGMNNGGGVGTTVPDLNQQAHAAGFNNIQAFIDARNKSKLMRMNQIQQQQAAVAAMQQHQQQQQQQQQQGGSQQPQQQLQVQTQQLQQPNNIQQQQQPMSSPSLNGNGNNSTPVVPNASLPAPGQIQSQGQGQGQIQGSNGVAGSPVLPTGHLHLKLPPHAKARLAGQQQVVVQRAQ